MNQPIAGKPGRYWHVLQDGRVQCDVCPRYCKLHEGQRGLCFVRARQGGQIVLTTYGRSSGFCIDPIEKKPLNHFLPGTPVLSFGTAGCNLTCKFCQNWDISKARDLDRIQGVATPETIADAALRSGCRSVAWSNKPFRDSLTSQTSGEPARSKAAQDALDERGIHMSKPVVITETEYYEGYTMTDPDGVVFVLPNGSRANAAGGSLLEAAKLLMACTPNGI
jgi:hypothetical protein